MLVPNAKAKQFYDFMINPLKCVKNVLQGLTIFCASFGAYYFILLENPDDASMARTTGISVLLIASLFLV